MSGKDEHIRKAIDERAVEWFVRHRDGEMPVAEKREFLVWLKASPQHVAAYYAVAGLSGKVGEAIRGLPVDREALYERVRHASDVSDNVVVRLGRPLRNTATGTQRADRFWRARLPLAAAALLIALVGAWYGMSYGAWDGLRERWARNSIAVVHGEQRTVRLSDGSFAYANSDTLFKVRYSCEQRLIVLEKGQALFDVFHDPRRPFVVRVGTNDIVAVGTKFDVYKGPEKTTVTVVEGRIKVIERAPESGAGAADSPLIPLSVGAGEKVEMTSHALSQPMPANVQQATAWVRHEVAFAGQPLSDVVREFNRYVSTPIVIEDDNLRAYRISGVFQTYDVDSFLAYLSQFVGIQIEKTGQAIHVKPRTKLPQAVIANQGVEGNSAQ